MGHSILALKPADTPDYMIDAWLGCVVWAISNEETLALFRTETGNRWYPGRSGLDRMIDQATDSDWKFIEAFVLWVNTEIWGPLDSETSL